MGETKDYGYIHSVDDLAKVVRYLSSHDGPLGFDIETGYHGPDRDSASLMPHAGSFIVGFSITDKPTWARYVPLRHDYGPNLPPEEVWPMMKPLLEQKRIVAHHSKFEQKNLRREGIELGVLACTMLQAFCLSEWHRVNLKELILWRYGHQMVAFEDLFPGALVKSKPRLRFNALPVSPEVVSYGCEDSAWALQFHLDHIDRVMAERRHVYQVEMLISSLMSEVEDWGVAADWEGMEKAYVEGQMFLPKMFNAVIAELSALAGRDLSTLNLNSPQQMRKLLFEELGMKPTRMTDGGKSGNKQPSTDAIALETLSKEYPAIRKMLDYREAETMVERLEKWLDVDPEKFRTRGDDDRIHASYAQAVVGTGRFAAKEPSIQNCPKKWYWRTGTAEAPGDEWRGNFRQYLVAAPGTYLLSFDFSQIELRILAGLSQEPRLVLAFERDEDIHSVTASLMLGMPLEAVDHDEHRPVGKTMNFALIYQMGHEELANRLGIPKSEGKRLHGEYFKQFTSVDVWIARQKDEGKLRGYTESWLGRKWTIWELAAESKAMKSKGERMLVNSPVQGGAADFVKVAMLRVWKVLRSLGWWGAKVKMVMNHHDALTFEVSNELDPRGVIKALLPAVEDPVSGMEGFPRMVSEWEFGKRWGAGVRITTSTPLERDDGEWVVSGERAPAEAAPSAPAPPPPGSGHSVIVELIEMPTPDEWLRFVEHLGVGPNEIVIRTPDGSFTEHGGGLDLDDEATVRMMLRGVRMYLPEDEVDAKALVGDLVL